MTLTKLVFSLGFGPPKLQTSAYILLMFFSRSAAQDCMLRALGNGGALAIALSALDNPFYHSPPPFYCSEPPWELDWTSFLGGLAIGIVLGICLGALLYPLASILLAYRWVVFRALSARIQEPPDHREGRALYRIVG